MELLFFFMDDEKEKRASVVFHENFLEVTSFTLIEMLYKIVQYNYQNISTEKQIIAKLIMSFGWFV